MRERLSDFMKVALVIGVCLASITFLYIYEGKANTPQHEVTTPPPEDTISSVPSFMEKSPREGLKEALIFYEIQYPEIVYAQAILETGHFKSVGCVKHNNLFGLYDSKAKGYYRFNHWTESVVAYREWIQKRYKPPEDYYKFLDRIGYARDSRYVKKLKQIVKER